MRNIAFVCAALLWVCACEPEKKPEPSPQQAKVVPPAPPPPPAPKPLMNEELAARYQKCWDAWNSRKWDDLSSCYADAATSTQAGQPRLTGKAAVVEGMKNFAGGFPDARGTPQLVLVDGRDVTAVVYVTGTNTAPFKGPAGEIPATSKKVGYIGTHRVHFDDKNLVTEESWVFDTPTMMSQLGLSKMPARPVLEKPWTDKAEVVVARNDDTEKKNIEATHKMIEMFNKRDKAFNDMLTDDVVATNIADPADQVGKKAVMAANTMLFKGFPDAKVEMMDVKAAGNYTFASERLTGTNSGPMGKMKKTGKAVNVNAFEVLEWKEGKVARDWLFLNGMEMAQQLGMMPEPAKDMKVGAVEK